MNEFWNLDFLFDLNYLIGFVMGVYFRNSFPLVACFMHNLIAAIIGIVTHVHCMVLIICSWGDVIWYAT